MPEAPSTLLRVDGPRMRALPALLLRRPDAQVILMGSEGVSYGAWPAQGTWQQLLLDEVKDDLDLS